MATLTHRVAQRIATAISGGRGRSHGKTPALLLPLCIVGCPTLAAATFGSGSKEVGHVEERNVSGTPGELEPTTVSGVSFPNDMRGTAGLGVGDGLNNHTDKWKSLPGKSPIDYVNELEPIAVHSNVVACSGDTFQGLGHPIEYIRLDDSSAEEPAVCKYCSNKFYHSHH